VQTPSDSQRRHGIRMDADLDAKPREKLEDLSTAFHRAQAAGRADSWARDAGRGRHPRHPPLKPYARRPHLLHRGTGPMFYLMKPGAPEVFARTLKQVLEYAAHQRTFQALEQEIDEGLQRAQALRSTTTTLRQAARELRGAAHRRRAEDDQEPTP
jgi:hypothetical protein